MNMRYDIELLKKRLGHLEENVGELRERIARLEAQCEASGASGAPGSGLGAAGDAAVIEPPPLPVSPADFAHLEAAAEPPPAPSGEVLPAPDAVGLGLDGEETTSFAHDAGAPSEFLPDAAVSAVYESEPSRWKPRLQKLHLWPPSPDDVAQAGGEGNAEVRLAAWWATRVGMALLVIGIAFLGVYFSLNVNPALKFAELLGVSFAIALGGLWLERKIPRFGEVVFGGGLALLYFCAFAAYAVPAVKVISDPTVAAAWQVLAAALMGAAALWRRSPVMATMATAFAVVAAVFAHARGMPGFALVTVFVLALAGVVFLRWKRWGGPSFVAMPGAYAVYALVWHGSWLQTLRLTGEAPAIAAGVWPWGFLGGMLMLHFFRDWRGGPTTSQGGQGERFFQGLNASCALVLGFATALSFHPAHLAVFYFSSAGVVGLLAALRQWRMRGDFIAPVLATQATGVLALGLIEAGNGRVLAIELLVQAWVVFLIARAMRSRFLVAWSALIALVGYGYFLQRVFDGIALVSFDAALAVLFVGGFSLFAAEMGSGRARRWKMANADATPSSRRTPLSFDGSGVVGGIGALLGAVAAMCVVVRLIPSGWSPVALILFAAVGAGAAWWRKVSGPGFMAGLLVVAAHGALSWMAWRLSANQWGWYAAHSRLLAGAFAVVLPTIAAGIFCARQQENRWLAACGRLALALAIFSVAQVLFALCSTTAALLSLVGLSVALAGVAPLAAKYRCGNWVTLATWAGLLGLVGAFWCAWLDLPTWVLALAAVALWLVPIGLRLRCLPRHGALRGAARLASFQEWLQSGLALVFTLCAVRYGLSRADSILFSPLAFGLVGLGIAWLAWRPGVMPALAASWVLWLFALQPVIFKTLFSTDSVLYGELALVSATALLVWVPACLSRRIRLGGAQSEAHDAAARMDRWHGWTEGTQATLGVLFAWAFAQNYFRDAGTYVVLIIAILVTAQIARWWHLNAARRASLVLAAGALGHAFIRTAGGHVDGFSLESGALVLLAGVVALLPFLVRGRAGAWSSAGRRRFHWIAGAAGLGLIFFAAWRQAHELRPFVTVIWGLGAIAIFTGGLLCRVRPYRLLGLVGLALCVPRMFFVDLHSALHRIAAFVVLGLVMLWVGFSYHKFRHLITEDNPDNPAADS